MARYSDLQGVLNNQFMCKHKNGEQYPDFGAAVKTDKICWSFLAGQGCGAMKVRSCLIYSTNFSIKSLSLPSNFPTHGYGKITAINDFYLKFSSDRSILGSTAD
jgi:hypothetical protein